MTIQQFDALITKQEGKKKSVSIGNVREVRSLINKALKGKLNKLIKEL